jgi:hypothetical protein
MKEFCDFLHELDLLTWCPAGYLDPGVLDLLRELGSAPELVSRTVNSWNARNLETRQLLCHETATHYKWFIYYHKALRYRVWLHQYKALDERRTGYATVPHNHRYSLASLVLRGGFDHHYFERRGEELIELTDERRSYSGPDAYTVDWRRVHMLSAVRDHTITLVVESPVVRHFSEAFYDHTGQPSLVYDFVELHTRLSEAVATSQVV